jgi:hypothetical protein
MKETTALQLRPEWLGNLDPHPDLRKPLFCEKVFGPWSQCGSVVGARQLRSNQ